MPGPITEADLSGFIPEEFARTIITETEQTSVVLQLGNRIPMGTKTYNFPVPKSFPEAEWTAGAGARKPVTSFSVSTDQMTAEEMAAVVLIPDQLLEDSDFNVWSYVQPKLVEAFAAKLDDTILWGDDAPATFPAGGVAAAATAVPGGRDAVENINLALSAIETQGLNPSGATADIAVRGALRGVRDDNGALLLGPGQTGGNDVGTIYGLPVQYRAFEAEATGDFIVGSWQYLFVGMRQDLRFRFSTDGTIVTNGETISLFQDNYTALKVWARYACAIVRPVTRRSGEEGANPFAVAAIAGTGNGGGGGTGGNGGGGTSTGGTGGNGGNGG